MKKLILLLSLVIACLLLTGCPQNEPNPTEAPANTPSIPEPTQEEVSPSRDEKLSAIKTVLKDDNWVKTHLYMTKDCFGDEASGDQSLTFEMFGDDKVIVESFAYDELFGIATTVVYYEDGEVKTLSLPELDAPYHPGHGGFAVDVEKQLLTNSYMHMGYYDYVYYIFENNEFNKFADFYYVEDTSTFNETIDESGNSILEYMVDYKIESNGNIDEGKCDFQEFGVKHAEFLDNYNIIGIGNELTSENIDTYIK